MNDLMEKEFSIQLKGNLASAYVVRSRIKLLLPYHINLDFNVDRFKTGDYLIICITLKIIPIGTEATRSIKTLYYFMVDYLNYRKASMMINTDYKTYNITKYRISCENNGSINEFKNIHECIEELNNN